VYPSLSCGAWIAANGSRRDHNSRVIFATAQSQL